MRPSQARVGRTHGALGRDADLGARRDALDGAERHQQGAGVAEADHLGGQGRVGAAHDLGAGADGQPRQTAAGLDQQAVHRRDPAGDGQRIDPLDGGDQVAQGWPRSGCEARNGRRQRC